MSAPVLWLTILFGLTALLYSAVGFGGGSTYNALLLLFSTPFAKVPIIALTCNIVVVMIGAIRFAQPGFVDFRAVLPLVVVSVPAAFVGAYLPVPLWLFIALLAVALFVAGALMLWQPLWRDEAPDRPRDVMVDAVTGGGIGLVAGVTGIGGGIYLSPVLHFRRWANAKVIAGTSALFILANSIAGLWGQVAKSGAVAAENVLANYWPLLPAIAVGGTIGSSLGAGPVEARYLRVVTGILIIFVALRLGFQFPDVWAKR
jgi:hypothetical protein